VNIFFRYWRYLLTWREHRDTIKQLNRLSNRELEDIGLSRADVDAMIWLEEDMNERGN